MKRPTCDFCQVTADHQIERIFEPTGDIIETWHACTSCVEDQTADIVRSIPDRYFRKGQRVIVSDWRLTQTTHGVWTRQLVPSEVI